MNLKRMKQIVIEAWNVGHKQDLTKFVLGFVLGLILPAYLFLTKYITNVDFGDVGEWVGSIATVLALIMVVWQVRQSEKATKKQLDQQFKHDKAVRIENDRPRFSISVTTTTQKEKIKEYLVPDTSTIEKEDISKQIYNYPYRHTFIEIDNLVEQRPISFAFYFEYQAYNKEDILNLKHEKFPVKGYYRHIGDLTDDFIYIIPPTAYLKDIFTNYEESNEMDGYRYTRVLLKFVSSKGEVGFAEHIGSNLLDVGISGLLRNLQYYFVMQDGAETDVFGVDKLISKDSSEFNRLNEPFRMNGRPRSTFK